jgi:hypothetical protein
MASSSSAAPAAASTDSSAAANGDHQEPPNFYEDEENLKKLCNFLRSSKGPPVREAVMMEKRVYYLKGAIAFVAIIALV